MVPANRFGFAKGFSGFQLKMIQEVITLIVFCFFAVLYLKEPLHWRYVVSFAFLLGAVYLCSANGLVKTFLYLPDMLSAGLSFSAA